MCQRLSGLLQILKDKNFSAPNPMNNQNSGRIYMFIYSFRNSILRGSEIRQAFDAILSRILRLSFCHLKTTVKHDIQKYSFAFCFVWVWNLFLRITERTWAEMSADRGLRDTFWPKRKEARRDYKMRSFVISRWYKGTWQQGWEDMHTEFR